MTPTKLFDFLGRALMAAVFVNAVPGKLTILFIGSHAEYDKVDASSI